MKRCICGRSKRLPICDGSHAVEDWACSADASKRAPWAFVAGPHEENLAERLAAELDGVAVHMISEPLRAERVVVITALSGLDAVTQLLARVDAPSLKVIAIDVEPALLRPLLGPLAGDGGDVALAAACGDGLELWRSVRQAVLDDAGPARRMTLARAFVSHAVADEPVVLPPLEYVRRNLSADLFVCADSIEVGAQWREQIMKQLISRPKLVWLLSQASAASTFCAFEVGYAMARDMPLSIISLDGTRPPSFVQHLHMIDVTRERASRPWLDQGEALVEALISALALGA